MFKLRQLAGIALLAAAISACEEDSLNIGNTLTGEADLLDFSSATFNVDTRTIVADSILTRSNTCYFGQIIDPETDSYVKTEFMTQFHILETFSLPDKENIVNKYNQMAAADSCIMTLYLRNPLRKLDSLAAMKMTISELKTPVEEGPLYYSNFDPRAKGLLRTDGGLVKARMFSYENLTLSNSERLSTNTKVYHNYISFKFNDPYTAIDGRTYNNYGTYIMQTYYEHPEYYRNSYHFIHNVCPGFFYEVNDGAGFYAEVPEIDIKAYYRVQSGDSIKQQAITLAGTREVLQTTKVTNDTDRLREIAATPTCTYIKAPAGLYTEVKLPVGQILAVNHENDSLLAANIAFKRLNSEDWEYERLNKPAYILMVQKDSLNTFFEKKKLADSKTSFYTACSADNTYQFSNISTLINTLARMRKEHRATDPTWDDPDSDHYKVVLVPIELTYYTNPSTNARTVTNIDHSMSVSSTRLVGGPDNPYDPVKISVVYSSMKGH